MEAVGRLIRSPVDRSMLGAIQSDSLYTPARAHLRWGVPRAASYAEERPGLDSIMTIHANTPTGLRQAGPPPTTLRGQCAQRLGNKYGQAGGGDCAHHALLFLVSRCGAGVCWHRREQHNHVGRRLGGLGNLPGEGGARNAWQPVRGRCQIVG